MRGTRRAGCLAGLILIALLGLCGCRGGPGKHSAKGSPLMKISGPRTEIVVDSAKVPGYWASQIPDGRVFFLFLWSLEPGYKKGDVLRLEGSYGSSFATVFDEATRVYSSGVPVNVFVAWKAAKA